MWVITLIKVTPRHNDGRAKSNRKNDKKDKLCR